MLNLKSGTVDRRVVAGIALLAAILLGLLYFGTAKDADNKSNRPVLTIMSSIPLQWGEATMQQIANGETEPSPLFDALSENSRPVLIDDLQKLGRPGTSPLLMIQPRALAPRELVQFDAWLREGGTAIIFADPALDWPSDRPLGDPRRPLFTSLLNPLFGHWGLQLALPANDAANAITAAIGTYQLSMKSPGIWVKSKNEKPAAKCAIRQDELIAFCTVGKGKVLLIADVDTLHEAQWTDSLVSSGTVKWLNEVIAALRNTRSVPVQLWDIQGN